MPHCLCSFDLLLLLLWSMPASPFRRFPKCNTDRCAYCWPCDWRKSSDATLDGLDGRSPAVLRRADAQCEAAFMAWASAVVVGVPDDAECDIGIHVACARVDETRYSDPERPE